MILKKLKIKTNFIEKTNCYIIADEDKKECMIIDPAGEAEIIIDMVQNVLKCKTKYIYITHCHGDHIGAVAQVKQKLGGKVLIHRLEAEILNNLDINLTGYIGMNNIELEADSRVNDDDLIHIGNIELKVIHTPGHTIGSSALYCEKENILFSGDTLFRGTWGRTDLPTSSFEDIIDSITNKLIVLPENTIVYPGHGIETMIYEETPIYKELKPRKELGI